MTESLRLTELLERIVAAGDDAERFDLTDELRDHPELESASPEAAAMAARALSASGDPGDLPAVARLSLVAHQAGIGDIGLIHAEASDKIALYTGRPQLYGTVMLEQNGEIVQPPVDGRIGDDERVALGVPPLAELEARMQALTRELAEERAATPGALPAGQPWCRVWSDPDPSDVRARLATGENAWAEGDILTIAKRTSVPFVAAPTFQIPAWPVAEDLFVLQVRVDRLAEAVLTYSLVEWGGAAPMNFSRGSHDGRFRGGDAPLELASNDDLSGTTFDHAIESDALGGPRRVTVYRPPGHERGEAVPVVYATDGNMFAPYMRRLDAAMVAGDCPRVVFVAAHSAPPDPLLGNMRAAEYLPGFDHGAFESHHRFFVDDLSAWAQAELGVSEDQGLRGVFGCSDGGGHALMIARRAPARFGHAFAYSTGMPPDPGEPWTEEHPFVHLCAGTLEGAFHQATEAWAGFLMLQGARHHFTERVAGHDLIQWAEELPRALARAWG